MKGKFIFLLTLLLLAAVLPAAAFDVIPSQDYPFSDGSNLPQYALEIVKIISHLLKRVYNIINTNV